MIRIKYYSCLIFTALLVQASQIRAKDLQDDPPIEKLTVILEELADYNYDSRAWLDDLRNVMREIYTSGDLKKEAEKIMNGFLESEATIAGKQAVLTELEVLATENSIPVLKELLDDSLLAEMALNVLETIPDEDVDKVLRKTLKKASDWEKPGIIQTLGNRGDEKSVKLLDDLIHDNDPLVASTAFEALGRIGNEKAADVLFKFYLTALAPLKWEVAGSCLEAADNLFRTGETETAMMIYRHIMNDSPPPSLRVAALQGVLKDQTVDAEKLFVEILQQGEDNLTAAIIPVIRDYQGELDFSRFADLFDSLTPDNKSALMIAFAHRGEEEVRPVALEALSSGADLLKMAGLQSMLLTGKPEDVLLFAETAAVSRGEVQEFARKCLYEMKGQETDEKILQDVTDAEPAVKVELIQGMAARNMTEGIPMLLQLSVNEERKVRIEAIRALGVIGQPGILDELVGLLKSAEGRAERNELTKTITVVAGKKADARKQSDELLSALPEIDDAETMIGMIEILGNLGNVKALPVLRVFITHKNPEVQYAAIRALSEWPNDDPVMDLKEIVENSKDPKKHALALQGYIRLISQSGTLSPDLKLSAYRQAFEHALNPEEKKLILSAIGTCSSIKGLEMLAGLLNNKEFQSEAEASFIVLLENIPGELEDEKRMKMNEALEISSSEPFRKKIQKMLEADQ